MSAHIPAEPASVEPAPDMPAPDRPAYAVGYGRPPVATRFQPGRSGNPRGRPRKARRDYRGTFGASWLDDVVLDEVYREVTLRENGAPIRLTALQASIRAIAIQAMRGSRLHARLLFDLTERIEARREAQRGAVLRQALEAKTRWDNVCRLAADYGRQEPEPPSPHPDTLRIDPRTGLVTLVDLPQQAIKSLDDLPDTGPDAIDLGVSAPDPVVLHDGTRRRRTPPEPLLPSGFDLLALRITLSQSRIP